MKILNSIKFKVILEFINFINWNKKLYQKMIKYKFKLMTKLKCFIFKIIIKIYGQIFMFNLIMFSNFKIKK